MVVHGIPGSYTLAEGDILSVDIGVTLDGWVADAACTFAVGEVSVEAESLIAVTEAS
jgi:methionyl aminopeptidase